MLKPVSTAQLAKLVGGSLRGADVQFEHVSKDSRTLQGGDLYVALRGENFDGHDFVAQAQQQGAVAALVEKAQPLDLPQVVVADSLVALGQLAAFNCAQFGGELIAITGSCGKTSVKEMLSAIYQGQALVTQGNLNNHIGMPLTALEIAPNHPAAILEMGASGPGEIRYLCDIAKPHIALVTNVMPAHLEGFGSLAGVAQAKGEIYQGLSPADTAVINADEPWVAQWQQDCRAKVLTFGLKAPADVCAENVELLADGSRFELCFHQQRRAVALAVPGAHNIANALAAAACALVAGKSLDAIAAGLNAFGGVAGRLQRQRSAEGALIINDSYNANPGSVKAAIDVLVKTAPHTVLVLGNMAELGEGAADCHRDVASYARSQGVSHLLGIGPFAHCLQQGFPGAQLFTDKHELVSTCRSLLNEQTAVLVKGSRSSHMEDIATALTDNNEDAS